jgi:hypothetical protein
MLPARVAGPCPGPPLAAGTAAPPRVRARAGDIRVHRDRTRLARCDRRVGGAAHHGRWPVVAGTSACTWQRTGGKLILEGNDSTGTPFYYVTNVAGRDLSRTTFRSPPTPGISRNFAGHSQSPPEKCGDKVTTFGFGPAAIYRAGEPLARRWRSSRVTSTVRFWHEGRGKMRPATATAVLVGRSEPNTSCLTSL